MIQPACGHPAHAMVNRICEKSLMYAFQQQRKLIDDYMVTFVVENEIAR